MGRTYPPPVAPADPLPLLVQFVEVFPYYCGDARHRTRA